MPEKKSEAARWAQVVATIFLGVVGIYFTRVQFAQQEKNREDQFALQEMNRKFEAGVELMSQRELSEMEFRQKMYDVLDSKHLDEDVDVRERVTRLKLFQHNFHDIFNARALFDVLEAEANKKPELERDYLIHELVSLAKEITLAQELLVGAEPNLIHMELGDTTTVELNLEAHGEEHDANREADVTLASNDGSMAHWIDIVLLRIQEHAVDLEVTLYVENHEPRKLRFQVSYFDAPLTDNTLFPDKHRFAITLKETDIEGHHNQATLNVFEFPADYVTTGYRPSIRESNRLIEGGLQH